MNIIVTENTQSNQAKFVFRRLDRVRVKGKNAGIAIYEVICHQTELTPELSDELGKFHTAQDHYFQQEWEKAFAILNQLHESFPQTKIYKIYMERIQEFQQQVLPADWDGVYVHITK